MRRPPCYLAGGGRGRRRRRQRRQSRRQRAEEVETVGSAGSWDGETLEPPENAAPPWLAAKCSTCCGSCWSRYSAL
jgi:hypothetical protein